MKQFSKKMYALTLCMVFSAPLYSAKLLTGDPLAEAGNTFSFNVGTYAFDSINGYFYTGAAEAPNDTASPYAISVTQLSSGIIAPNAPVQAYVNGSLIANPFYSVVPTVLGLSGTQLLAVATGSITDLYAFTSAPGSNTVTMLKSNGMLDAAGQTSSGVVASDHQQTVVGTGSTIFAAVKPNGGNFGSNFSGGIAIYVPAADGSGLVQQGNAKKIDKTIDKLKIGNNIDSLTQNIIDMYCDSYLQRLYVAVQPIGGDQEGDGARAILVGRLQNNNGTQELEFSAIAPEACFPDANRIVGGKKANGIVPINAVIYKVRTMHTSTGLSYLIVNGDTVLGMALNSQQKVFALPLVDENSSSSSIAWTSSATHGTLASVNSVPTVNWTLGQFGAASSEFFYSRTYATPATQANHLYDSTTLEAVPAMVGGGEAGIDVTDMFVYRDTVFISAEINGGNTAAGIYYSQALFNANGSIKGWTTWQRAFVDEAPETSTITGMAYSSTKGNFTFIECKINGIFNKIKSTQWSDGSLDSLLGGTSADSSVGLVAQLKNEFPESNGGIQGFFTFPKITPGFAQNLEVGVATGYKKVVIAQLGSSPAGVVNAISPQAGDFTTNKVTKTDGTWGDTTGGSIMVSVTGGSLDTLGAITSATIVNSNVNGGYLIVAGVGGVAALRDTALGQEGNGWEAGRLQKNFANMPTTMRFDVIGNFSNVIKLWCAGENLYVLTPTSLTRIANNALNANQGADIAGTIIATPAGMGLPSSATFADFVASNSLGVLATSEGLYRTSNGFRVSEVGTNVFGNWTNVLLPGGYAPVTRLVPVTANEFANEFAGTQNGNLYVLNASVSEQAAAVYRFAVGDATAGVSNGTLQLIQDQLLKDTTGPLASLGAYRNHFYSDGALLTISRSKNNTENALFQFFPLSYSTQQKIFSKNSVTPIDLGIGATSALNNVVRNPSQGGWLMSGSFGLVVNE